MTNLEIFLIASSFFGLVARHFEQQKEKKRFNDLFLRNSKLFDDLNAERLKNQKLEIQVTSLEVQLGTDAGDARNDY